MSILNELSAIRGLFTYLFIVYGFMAAYGAGYYFCNESHKRKAKAESLRIAITNTSEAYLENMGKNYDEQG